MRLIKESGGKEKDMALGCGKEQTERFTMDNGAVANLKVLGCWRRLTEMFMKASSKRH